MPNEKLPQTNEQDAVELLDPSRTPEEERTPRLLPKRWSRRVQKSSARMQARRRVAEKASEDHAYLMLGAVPFWAVGATSLQNALILCAVLIVLMLPCSALHLILRRRLNMAEWLALPLTVLVAAMLAAACCGALVLYWPGAFDSLGIYLFLLVAAPVLLQADSYTSVDNMREFWGRTLRFLRDFCIIILVSGVLRELLRHNTVLGLSVAMGFRTEAAEQPFFGLILSGFLLAVLRAVEAALRHAIHRRRQAETVTETEAKEGDA